MSAWSNKDATEVSRLSSCEWGSSCAIDGGQNERSCVFRSAEQPRKRRAQYGAHDAPSPSFCGPRSRALKREFPWPAGALPREGPPLEGPGPSGSAGSILRNAIPPQHPESAKQPTKQTNTAHASAVAPYTPPAPAAAKSATGDYRPSPPIAGIGPVPHRAVDVGDVGDVSRCRSAKMCNLAHVFFVPLRIGLI